MDLTALLDATASHYVFIHSAVAVVAVETALLRTGIAKLALYEPPLITATTHHGEWVPRYEAFANLGCDVLLLGGSKSARNLTASWDELAAVLPNPSRVLLWEPATRHR